MRWDQSRLLRASLEASMASTAPTSFMDTAATSLRKPGRFWEWAPERPRSSSMTSTSFQPNSRALSARAYWRRWLSRLLRTWSGLDCRM